MSDEGEVREICPVCDPEGYHLGVVAYCSWHSVDRSGSEDAKVTLPALSFAEAGEGDANRAMCAAIHRAARGVDKPAVVPCP